MQRYVLAFLVIASASAPAWAQGEIALAFRDADATTMPILQGSQQWVSILPQAARGLLGLPEDLTGEMFYGAAILAGRAYVMAVPAETADKLYLDTDYDGDLADETPVEGVADGADHVFGPMSVTVGDGPDARPVCILVRFEGLERRLICLPGGCWSGEIDLGGATRRVAFVDGDYDGLMAARPFSLAASRSRRFDRFAIDRDSDGRFGAGEIQPVPRLVECDGVWYAAETNSQKLTLRLTRTEPEFGTIDAGTPDVLLYLASDTGLHLLSGGDGKLCVPAGTYFAWGGMTLSAKDADGARWSMKGDLSAAGQVIAVGGGETVSLDVMPVVKVGVRALDDPRQLYITTWLETAGGVRFVGAYKGQERQPAPSLRILGESGKELFTGKFNYG